LLLLGAYRVDRMQVGGELLLEPAAFAGVGGGVDGLCCASTASVYRCWPARSAARRTFSAVGATDPEP
jgi:hypothetical protein